MEATRIRADRGRVTLDFLRDLDTDDAEAYLRTLPGVGMKVAKCVLLYALGRPVFPVDVHCRRVMERIGWIPLSGAQMTDAQQRRVEAFVPPEMRYDLHVRLVQHGRATCRPAEPLCQTCPVAQECASYEYFTRSSLS